MREPTDLHDYQVRAVNHIVQNPQSMLFVGTGLGKTAMVETAVAHLRHHRAIKAALVLAPKRVCEAVWRQEATHWTHLQHLRFSVILGNKTDRVRAITRPADIYLCSYDNVKWLFETLEHYYASRVDLLPFDMLVMDESTKMKSPTSKRLEAILPYLKFFRYRVGMTGTPATKGLEDLFGQFLCVDSGYRLGTDYSAFLSNYFESGGFGGYRYTPTEHGEAFIHRQVSDIVLQLKKEDYLNLPDVINREVLVDLPAKARKIYDDLELQLWAELEEGKDLEIDSPAALVNKLLQIANGNVYTNTELRTWEKIHDAKLDALDEVIEEAAGQPVLLAYNFKPDAERIMEKYPYAVNLTGLTAAQFNQAIADWNEGKIRLMLGHPASIGHGVDGLQKGGHILVWFGNNWSLELTLQMRDRLQRQGQGEPVVVTHIRAKDTADFLVKARLSERLETQNTLEDAVEQYRKLRGKKS